MAKAKAFCPQCPHCTAGSAVASVYGPPVTLAMLRPWEFAGYGQKITSIVDFYDGWWIGTRAMDKSEGQRAPEQIIDKRQWLAGFYEGWTDSEQTRQWRAEHPEFEVSA